MKDVIIMDRKLPFVSSLRHAVETVCHSNSKDGYPPTYFDDLLDLDDSEMKYRVETWLESEKQFATIASILYNHKAKKFLTLEDLIAKYGLGLSQNAQENARRIVEEFNTCRGFEWIP
jgi:hypothetical protein